LKIKKLYHLGENHFFKGVVYLLKTKKLYHLGENHFFKNFFIFNRYTTPLKK
jgi:hypothetical protein